MNAQVTPPPRVASHSAVARLMLRMQKPVLWIWGKTPQGISRLFIRWLRGADGAIGFGFRYLCLWRLSQACGRKVIVFPHVFLLHPDRLSVGTGVSIHEFTYIDAYGSIQIGNNVAIAHGCSILSSDHQVDDLEGTIKDAPAVSGSVLIEDGAWLGAGCRILKGVTIGRGAVIGAGAVVTKDIPAHAIAAGVPAKVIRFRRIKGLPPQ